MTAKRRKKASEKKRVSDGKVFILFAIILVGVFLWGRVHIDFLLQETGALENQKGDLIHEIDDMQVSANHQRRYQRIVDLAQMQGLAFVDASDFKPLIVDFKGIEYYQINRNSDMHMASLQDMVRWIKEMSQNLNHGGQ